MSKASHTHAYSHRSNLGITNSNEEKYTLFMQDGCDTLTADSTALITYAASQLGGMENFQLFEPRILS
ncbi:MAG: hypothetical protein HQL49_10785 [Gammaproteobacteria bacterium]|nr:hypothetical protein [Gammaproteobacteria bacterium]